MLFVPAGETAAAGPQKEGLLRKGQGGRESPAALRGKPTAGETTRARDKALRQKGGKRRTDDPPGLSHTCEKRA